MLQLLLLLIGLNTITNRMELNTETLFHSKPGLLKDSKKDTISDRLHQSNKMISKTKNNQFIAYKVLNKNLELLCLCLKKEKYLWLLIKTLTIIIWIRKILTKTMMIKSQWPPLNSSSLHLKTILKQTYKVLQRNIIEKLYKQHKTSIARISLNMRWILTTRERWTQLSSNSLVKSKLKFMWIKVSLISKPVISVTLIKINQIYPN